DWLRPYAAGEKQWEWEQITDFDKSNYFELFRRAAIYYEDTRYEEVLHSFNRQEVAKHIVQLIYPN
ncbi:MAG: hypothetical protein KAQ69_01855, partial [Spirochaetales bacterium]|nr:hypothetical protein [Spirochaetales bacterium]